MKRSIFCIIILLLTSNVFAEELVVGVKHAPPFVNVEHNNDVSGFSIDLIQSVVKMLDEPYEIKFHVDPDLKTHLKNVVENKVDFGIAATSITSERESLLDFSQPFYQADLGILIANKHESSLISFLSIILSSKELIMTLLGIVAYILVIAHLVWFIEKDVEGTHFPKKYSHGIGDALWWTVVTISTVGYGDFHLKRPLGRILGIFVIFSGIMIFGFAIASLSSLLTVNQLKPEITGPKDLPSRTVAVLPNTFTAKVIKKIGANEKFVNTLEEGLLAVKTGKADALVHDRPLLQFLVKDFEKREFLILENGFAPSNYGITFPHSSQLREKIDVALLKIMEGGNESPYNKFHLKWFGKDYKQ